MVKKRFKKIVEWEGKPSFIGVFFAISVSTAAIMALWGDIIWIKIIWSIFLPIPIFIMYLDGKIPKRKVYYEEV